MMRNAWIEANHPVRIGMFAACPDGNGFKASFSDFKVTQQTINKSRHKSL